MFCFRELKVMRNATPPPPILYCLQCLQSVTGGKKYFTVNPFFLLKLQKTIKVHFLTTRTTNAEVHTLVPLNKIKLRFCSKLSEITFNVYLQIWIFTLLLRWFLRRSWRSSCSSLLSCVDPG